MSERGEELERKAKEEGLPSMGTEIENIDNSPAMLSAFWGNIVPEKKEELEGAIEAGGGLSDILSNTEFLEGCDPEHIKTIQGLINNFLDVENSVTGTAEIIAEKKRFGKEIADALDAL